MSKRAAVVGALSVIAIASWAALAGCAQENAPRATATPDVGPSSAPVPEGFARAGLLVDTAWLARNLDAPGVRVLDVRSADDYRAGHVPGAVNVPTSRFTADVDGLPTMAPSPDAFATAMEQAGVGDDTHVIIVDAGNMLLGSRLLWTLDYFGHARTSALHGGQAAWVADGRDVTRVAPAVPAATFTSRTNPDLVVSLDAVLKGLDGSGPVMLDSRSAAEYAGEDVRAKRGGHIPGAVNVDWALHLNRGDVPTLKSPAALKALYEAAGITGDKSVATYCQTAARATHAYLVLRLLGYDRVAVYDGSWIEWGGRDDTPIEQ